MEYLRVNKSNRETILELFGKSLDAEGYIIDKKTKKRIKCGYCLAEIKVDNFSVLPGAKNPIFVNNNSCCIAEHRAKHDIQIK